jgi:hypothetical protein
MIDTVLIEYICTRYPLVLGTMALAASLEEELSWTVWRSGGLAARNPFMRKAWH